MFNILALIIISAFIPTIIIGGAKFYNYTNYQKLIKVFTITIFDIFCAMYYNIFIKCTVAERSELL